MKNIVTKWVMAAGVTALAAALPASADEATVKQQVEKLGLEVASMSESPISGFYQVVTNQGLLYASTDGQQLLAGQLFDISGSDVVNMTELAMAEIRQGALQEFADEMIVYPAENEQHRITVFTDHTCGYCQTLHRNMDDYHAAGITVQYLAYPRSGMGSSGARALAGVWCADDQQEAMDLAKMGEPPAASQCDLDIGRHYQLGQQFGVTGTPAIVLADGRMLAGYRPAAAILEILE